MAAWPSVDDLKQVLNVVEDDWNDRFDVVLAAAIYRVKQDAGAWDEMTDVPDESQSQAALRMAELIAQRPEGATVPGNDPTYTRLLFGHRQRFAVS